MITNKAWSSILIFLGLYFGCVIALQFFHNMGHPYPSSGQRQQKPQSAHYRPLIVSPFVVSSGNLSDKEQIELYTKGSADDFAFKSIIFSQRKGF